jgi:hypothetical protein
MHVGYLVGAIYDIKALPAHPIPSSPSPQAWDLATNCFKITECHLEDAPRGAHLAEDFEYKTLDCHKVCLQTGDAMRGLFTMFTI